MNLWETQKAIYSKLHDTLNVPVYDDVPQGVGFPYVNIGEDTSLEWDTDTSVGLNSTLTVHTWSRKEGRREAKEIMGHVYDALHRQTLEVTGAFVILVTCEFQETFLEADGRTRHGVQRFRVVQEAKNE